MINFLLYLLAAIFGIGALLALLSFSFGGVVLALMLTGAAYLIHLAVVNKKFWPFAGAGALVVLALIFGAWGRISAGTQNVQGWFNPTTVAAPPPYVAPTAVPPVEPTPAPDPAGDPTGMKYQFDEGCAATSEPLNYPACILQRVQAGEMSGEDAVRAIQALAQKFGAPSYEGMELSFANTQPVVAWCPAGAKYFPPDTARPLEGTTGAQWADLLFVVDAGTGGPDRRIEAKDHPCWMVYVR